jgi:hypothetical protein
MATYVPKDTKDVAATDDLSPQGVQDTGGTARALTGVVDGSEVRLSLPSGAATQATLATLLTQVTGAAIEAALDAIKDTAGIKKITDALPAGTNVIGSMKLRGGATAVDAEVSQDAVDSRNKLWIQGSVSISTPEAPDSATAVTILGDTPLDISGTEDSTAYVIPDGETFTLQQIIAGAEGDTSERGTAIEVYYDDVGTDRLVFREYITGFTSSVTVNVSEARDGTALVGNAGGTKKIFLRRRRLSGGSLEVDAVAFGFVE